MMDIRGPTPVHESMTNGAQIPGHAGNGNRRANGMGV